MWVLQTISFLAIVMHAIHATFTAVFDHSMASYCAQWIFGFQNKFVLINTLALLHPLNWSIGAGAAGEQRKSQFKPLPKFFPSFRQEYV